MLPFGLNNAAFILTKLMKFPLSHWRKYLIKSFIHLDDGIGAAAGQFQAQMRADEVKKELEDFGLLTSEEKCGLTVSQVIEWMGWRIEHNMVGGKMEHIVEGKIGWNTTLIV